MNQAKQSNDKTTSCLCLSSYVPLHKKRHIGNVSLCDVISVDNHVLFVSPSKLFFFTSFAEVQEIMNLSMTVISDIQCVFFVCVAISLEVLLLAQKKSDYELRERKKFFSSWLKLCHSVEQKIPKLWQFFHVVSRAKLNPAAADEIQCWSYLHCIYFTVNVKGHRGHLYICRVSFKKVTHRLNSIQSLTKIFLVGFSADMCENSLMHHLELLIV